MELAQNAVTLDRASPHAYWSLGFIHLFRKEYAEAVGPIAKALEHNEQGLLLRIFLAAVYVNLNQLDDAAWEVEQAMIQFPGTKLSQLANALPFEDDERLNRFIGEMRNAGVPE